MKRVIADSAVRHVLVCLMALLEIGDRSANQSACPRNNAGVGPQQSLACLDKRKLQHAQKINAESLVADVLYTNFHIGMTGLGLRSIGPE